MARIADLPLKHRIFVTAYRFRELAPVPWTPLTKPLAECRVALVTTAAYYLPGQQPFDASFRGGDPSYRVLPVEGGPSELAGLRIGHRSTAFDASGIERDYNVALPVDRFRELESRGEIGKLYGEALSFMGSITAPGRLRRETAPRAAEFLASREVDAAFLTPV